MNGTALIYEGTLIRDRDDRLNLTDMWKAAGTPQSKSPAQWYALQVTQEFIDYICSDLNMPISDVWQTKPGRGGGTWAHWQIGIAYAKWLEPAFHAWCNTVVRAFMEGRLVAAGPAAEILEPPAADLTPKIIITEGEPRVRDMRLAKALGFTRPSNIRNLIKRHAQELATYGPLLQVEAMVGTEGIALVVR